MGLAEVTELYTDHVPEGIRLEYKSQVPQGDSDLKDEMAKAISSFANTFGGYFVVGISTDADGNPVAMNGVPAVPGYSQRVASIGYQDVYPPLIPTVSNPIALANGNVIYVVYQDLSLEAPHFRTRRRGAYVRTNEFSQRFEPQLATWDELRFLANRRAEAVRLRDSFISQSRERGGRLIPQEVWNRNPSTLMVWTSPAFPARPLVDHGSLQDAIERSRVRTRGAMFPLGDPLSVKDTIGLIQPAMPQYVESNTYGVSFALDPFGDEAHARAIPAAWVLSYILIWIRYGVGFLRACGYDGQLHTRVTLFRVGGKEVTWRPHDFGNDRYICHENEISVEAEDTVQSAAESLGRLALRLFRPLVFGAGWRQVFEAPDAYLLERAFEFLRVTDDFLRMA